MKSKRRKEINFSCGGVVCKNVKKRTEFIYEIRTLESFDKIIYFFHKFFIAEAKLINKHIVY